ncbi:MAG: protein kinase domain-containing protein [Betaproteobacteria bacterium]|jgi:serine/threonine protein kinase|nr:HDOD domain-containing protein [Rubrivivax sp.]
MSPPQTPQSARGAEGRARDGGGARGTASPPRQVGRYELRREIGRGAQATVWLAHDPRLQRDVALKLLSADADPAMRSEWLNEGRACSTLKHPNVVPVFEAGEDVGQPYLVFEYVEGVTLAARLKGQPRLPAREAVGLMLGVLDALAAAHDQGIVHRDLKPSNILLGGDGRPRVMDFGIAARVQRGSGLVGGHDGRIVGTSGYISPEAARGEPPQPSMDVFAAGAMLGEMLSGEPLLKERDPWRAIQRVQSEDLTIAAGGDVDEGLRAIVLRALSRDAAQRFDTARAMHEALAHWLDPGQQTLDTSHATLEFLLRRMRHKSDFPALSSSVLRIQKLTGSDTESLRTLSDQILKDVSLTNKLLRMVNTVHFTAVTGEPISSVSRAVALVGMAGIRNMALSVVLLEHMQDKAHAAVLKEEFLRALMAGTLAGDLTPQARQGEEAFLGAMFQNLGRLLTEYYFPEEAQRIRQLTAGPGAVTRDVAAKKLLGLSLNDLGVGVARAWGLPKTLQKAMRYPTGEASARRIDPWVDEGCERMRWLARGANELTDAMLGHEGVDQAEALSRVAERFGPALGLEARQLLQAASGARSRLSQLAQAMGLTLAPGAAARRLLQASPGVADPRAQQAAGEPPQAGVQAAPRLVDGSPLVQLSSGLETVRSAVQGRSLAPDAVLRLVLEILHRSLDLRSAVLCTRDPQGGALVGRVATGARAAELPALFRVPLRLGGQPDLFAAICARGADLLVADGTTVAPRLPTWYRENLAAPTFLLLPILLKGAPAGLIYADKAEANTLVLGDTELLLVKALRDQAATMLARP